VYRLKRLAADNVYYPISKRVCRYLTLRSRRRFGRSIPVAMITGTKGQTTTVRMLTHVLTGTGHRVGYTCTDGVVVAGEYVCRGDRSGGRGTHELLGHRDITAAVLETERGGLLERGLYLKRCEVAALLNVNRE